MPIGVKYHHCFLLKGLLQGITTGEVPGRSSLSDLMRCARSRLCARAFPFMRKSVPVYAQGGIHLFNCFLTVSVYAQKRSRLCAEKNQYLYDFLMKYEKVFF